MFRVVGGRRSQGEYLVIARVFALDTRAARGIPRQRVEPIQSTEQLNRYLSKSILALDVRQLMRQHDASSLFSPFHRAERQEYGVADNAGCHRGDGVPHE